jgi:hypothetical protein
MKKSHLLTPCILGALAPSAFARGVSPYLPLNLEPEIERQIERVLILGEKPVMTRPIAAATVLDALPKACAIDVALCEQVRRYLARYTSSSGITHVSVEGASSQDADRVMPNRYGLRTSSGWQASAQAFFQPSDYLLVTAGGVAFEGDAEPTGSVASIGFSYAQLDIGYRGHWLSPMTDSAMLLSTEAPTMPSVTLSNYTPMTRFGLHYEVFMAEMTQSTNIRFQGRTTSGHPRIAGLHLSMEPASGWSLGVNRIMQYGGGERGGNSLRDVFDAFFQPSRFDNAGPGTPLTEDAQFGNQAASLSSRFLFPGKVPFSVYFEYGGEDTSRGKNYLLGNSALSAGIHFPRLFRHFDFTYETSEWQNNWYIHGVYRDGLTNDGLVTGHWGADQRVFNNDVGARTQMARLGWEAPWGGLLELRYRTQTNEEYRSVAYERAHDITARYSQPFKNFTVGGEVFTGQDVFGQDFSRVAAFVRYTPQSAGFYSYSDDESSGSVEVDGAEIFVDAGANANQVKVDVASEVPEFRTDTETSAHFAVGARRAVSARSDLGVRAEYDDINGRSLIGVRALDYRYRFTRHFAAGVFLGAARYNLETPAYGLYGGVGVQWRNFVFQGWDIGVDLRYASKVARDQLLPSDPVGTRPDSFYDITSTTLYLTKRF